MFKIHLSRSNFMSFMKSIFLSRIFLITHKFEDLIKRISPRAYFEYFIYSLKNKVTYFVNAVNLGNDTKGDGVSSFVNSPWLMLLNSCVIKSI